MSGPYVEQTAKPAAAETGPALSEDVVMALAEHYRYLGCSQPVDPTDPEDCASVAAESVRFLTPYVAALVAKAERRGEERGAQAERNRIAKAIERVEFAYEDHKSSEHYRNGYVDGLGNAVDIARGKAPSDR